MTDFEVQGFKVPEGPKQVIGQAGRHQVAQQGGRFAGRTVAAQRELRAQPAAQKPNKKESKAPIGIMIFAVVGSLFVAYAFNAGGTQSKVDAFANGIGHSMHKHDSSVGTMFITALPFIAMVFGLAFVWLALQMIGLSGGKKKKVAPVLREEMSVHDFAEWAKEHGAGARVAREAYRILNPDYAATLRSTMTSEFTAGLQLPQETVKGMFEDLVERSGGVLGKGYSVASMGTPLAMMLAAEACVERAALERRAALRAGAAVVEDKGRAIVPLPAGRR